MVDIRWLGHSSFRIKDKAVVYIDPYQVSNAEKADIIFITHPHFDHFSIETINHLLKENTKIVCPLTMISKVRGVVDDEHIIEMKPNDEKEVHLVIGGKELEKINITAVPAYNINKQFHNKDEGWLGYIIEIDGKKVYHAGDTDLIPEMGKLMFRKIDYALLPIGGTYTMNTEEALKAKDLIGAKKTIPMHYGTIPGTGGKPELFDKLTDD